MADSDDEELVEPVRGLSLRPPAEQEQGSEEEVEGLFTPPPGRPADVDEERQKSRVRSGGGEKSVHERERWTTPAQGIQPFVPRERPKPSVLETKNEMPACFTHRPILSPSYAWRCPYPSCVYEMDFLRPSAQFRDSLTQEEVAVASGVHAAHTSSRLNGVFYIKVMQHYQTHLGELKVQWPVRLRA
ncbi:hypothetical protein CALVIDRAFT_539937 [Calocera viscosa TUFC12733]|uniref:Uncharacterized protein n=1 Tax=Calocera viscosa (strain TUFC12733) TaxID=1330018 RepID=A0A167JDH3_CALVF|nr:hypothetical protein CALVIDRAFT_539937 [Calocera viscosa TUFC12733]